MNKQGEEKEIGTIIGIILVVAFAIKLAQALLPFLIIAGIVCLVALIASFFWFEDASLYIGIGLAVCIVGGIISWGVGYGFGESDLGKAVTNIQTRQSTLLQEKLVDLVGHTPLNQPDFLT